MDRAAVSSGFRAPGGSAVGGGGSRSLLGVIAQVARVGRS